MTLRSLVLSALSACAPAAVPVPADPTVVPIEAQDVVLKVRGEAYAHQSVFHEYLIAADGAFRMVGEEPQRGFFMRAGGRTVHSVPALLAELRELGVHSVDEAAVWRQIQELGGEVNAAHSGSRAYEVTLDGRTTRFQFHSIEFWAEHLPESAEVQRAAAVVRAIEEFLDRCCRP